MKTLIPFTLAAALAASGFSHAQSASSKPSGYSTKALSQGFNLMGLTLQGSPSALGRFETVTSTTLTDTQMSFTPVAGRTYSLEFISGTANGAIFEVASASISSNTITIETVPATNLNSLGITTTDDYKLRLAPTLEEIFTTASLGSGGILQAGFSSVNADIIWIPSGTGTYSRYFLHTTGVFRIANTTTAAPNVPVIYSDGFLIQKKNSLPASITITGEVKTTQTISILGGGFNLVSVVSPVGVTLANAGLEDDIQAGFSDVGADIVWVQNSALSFVKYFRHTSGNWRNVIAPTVNLTLAQTQAITLPEALLIQRKSSASVMLDVNVPASYSGL